MAIISILLGLVFIIIGIVLLAGLKAIPEFIIDIIVSIISSEFTGFSPDKIKVSKKRIVLGFVVLFLGLACFIYGLLNLRPNAG